jgi:hypothetical protein
MVGRELKIVRLLNPNMCLECSFAKVASVEDEMGFHSRMIQCGRLDCDNWDVASAEPVRSVRDLEE